MCFPVVDVSTLKLESCTLEKYRSSNKKKGEFYL
jgi:hypothetical protein